MKSLTEAADELRTLTFEIAAAARSLGLLCRAAQEDPRHLPDARVAYHVFTETLGALREAAPGLAEAIQAGLHLPPEGGRDEAEDEDEAEVETYPTSPTTLHYCACAGCPGLPWAPSGTMPHPCGRGAPAPGVLR